MSTMEKILLPVDFSERCVAAARFARPLACKYKSRLTLFHALSHPACELGAEAFLPMVPQLMELAEDELDSFGAAELAGLHTRRLVVPGDPSKTILEFAHQEKPDLIVMPTHGYGPFRRFILGSTTAKVLHDAECPVMTCTHLETIPERGSVHFDNVVCAVDLGANSASALSWAANFAHTFQARLFLVHAIPSLPSADGDYYRPVASSPLPTHALEQMAALKAQVGVEAISIVAGGDILKAVARQARELSADLLVIGRSTANSILGRLRTQAYGLIRESPCPVVSI